MVQLLTEKHYLTHRETRFSGDSSGTHDSDNVSGYNGIDSDGDRLTSLAATGMPTVDAEELGASTGSTFNEMGFTIEKSTVTAVSRKNLTLSTH